MYWLLAPPPLYLNDFVGEEPSSESAAAGINLGPPSRDHSSEYTIHMTNKELADFLVAILRVFVSWPVLAVVFIIIFRSQIATFLLSIRRLTREGIEIAPQSQQATREPAPVTTSSAVEAERLMRADSPILLEQENRIRQDIQSHGLSGQDLVNVLVRRLAVYQWSYFFESVYSVIWGSQLRILQYLNPLSTGALIANVQTFYAEAARQYPAAFASYPFENYIRYLESMQLITKSNGNVAITPRGREFLVYLTRMGKALNKFY